MSAEVSRSFTSSRPREYADLALKLTVTAPCAAQENMRKLNSFMDAAYF